MLKFYGYEYLVLWKLRKYKNVSLSLNFDQEFMKIIAGWNSFKGHCEEAGLDTVCEKLCEIFPLLIKADEVQAPQDDKEPNDE